MASLWVFISLLILGLASDVAGSSLFRVVHRRRIRRDVCAQHSNGCSTPRPDFFYRTEFTPSCDRHDVCYGWGAVRGVTRNQCDVYFRDNMMKTCGRLRRRRDVLSPTNQSDCTAAAGFYYAAVRLLGASHYSDVNNTDSYCTVDLIRACVP